jgi:hypothetical protein
MQLTFPTIRVGANFLLRGSFVVAFMCSCSSSETGEPNPSATPGSGGADTGAGTGGSDAVPGTSGGDTGAGTGGSDTVPGTSGGDTGAGTGGGDTGTGVGGNDTVPGAGGGDTGAGIGGSDTGTGGTEAGAGGSQVDPGSGGDTGSVDSDVIVLLAGDDVNTAGPLQTTLEEDLNFSGGGHILVRPTDITTEPNTKHPVAIWGPGGGTAPGEYMQLLTRMASQGFVVVGIRESTGDSVLMSAAIDWLEEQDADPSSPLHDRLILNRVGVFGHSMGGLSSEATALVDDRVTTALLDNSGSFSHDALVTLTMPVGIIYGETGQEAPNAQGDFNNPGNQGPCWLSRMAGGGHGSGPWDGAAANVAWMRWHIGGENSRKNAFLGDGGAYNDTGIWQTDFKNWEDWTNWNE